MSKTKRAGPATLVAISLTAAVLLAYQICATRILSATSSYHAAFAVIALVMLGLAASGTRLYLDRRSAPIDPARTTRALVRGSIATVLGMVFVVAASHVGIGFRVELATIGAFLAFYPPFYFAGYAIASLLTDYADDVGRLYWADLVGAAAGCFAVVPLLSLLTPIQLGFVCALLLSASAYLLARTTPEVAERPSLVVAATVTLVTLVAVAVPSTVELGRAKAAERPPMWSSWNHLNRVAVYDEKGSARIEGAWDEAERDRRRIRDIGWGISQQFAGPLPDVRQILLDHDAGTPIIEGALNANLDVLRWDITALGHHAKGDALGSVFILGGGGGRDILTAKLFGAEQVDVVELNPDIVHVVQDVMGKYSARPYSLPGVSYAVGDARSELDRRETRYDLIQMSMIDTWAASSSGALALTENVLYTREAFDIYRERLDEDGILAISRWYNPGSYGELARLLAMLGDSLKRGGITDPDRHVVVAYIAGTGGGHASTTLLKLTPFTDDELARIDTARREKGFTVIWPTQSKDAHEIDVARLLRGEAPAGTELWLEVDPATDNFPFFFNTFRPVMSYVAAIKDGSLSRASPATMVLLFLLAIALLASWFLVMRPLRSAVGETDFGVGPLVYFSSLGAGFILVELALIQRLTIYLGHPTYALTIVLASILFFGGVGSYLSQRIQTTHGARRAALAVVAAILLCAFALPPLTSITEPWSLPARQALAVAFIIPVGIALGMMYPLGIKHLVNSDRREAVPWAWAINGVWGVLASILGMLIAMSVGYAALLYVAVVAYVFARWALGRF